MSKPLRVLIVDDEPLGLERVRSIIRTDGRLQIVGECASGAEAVQAVQTLSPDILLLDIQMPGMDGFEVIAQIDSPDMPVVIFVTAYDTYAIRAFDVNAVDYVLKPVDPARLATAIDRAVESLGAQETGMLQLRMTTLLRSLQAREKYATRIAVPDKGGAILLRVSDVDWIEAAGNYVRVHSGDRGYVLRESLAAFEKRLDPAEFVRVNRSAIANINSIQRAEPWSRGEYTLLLRNGARLTSSRAHGQALRNLLG